MTERALRYALLSLVSNEPDDKRAARYLDMLEAHWRFLAAGGGEPYEELKGAVSALQAIAATIFADEKTKPCQPYDMRLCGSAKWSNVVTNSVLQVRSNRDKDYD
jgi:hypothetical protein